MARHEAKLLRDARRAISDKNFQTDALVIMEKYAREGNPYFQLKLGNLYRYINFDLAIYWLKKTAKQGNRDAMYHLSQVYVSKKDYISALKWFERAKKSGSSFTIDYMGELISEFKIKTPNETSAKKYYARIKTLNEM